VRSVGLDVHRDFCGVAIIDPAGGRARGRVPSTREGLELFARSLAPSDRVALEVTGNAWEIARILEAHVARVVVVSPSDTGIRQARAKTDRLDAVALAKLLAAGSLDAIWMPDEPVRAMRRRLARRSQLVNARSRVKNEVHAVLVRCLKGRPPASDLFGRKGRAWLGELELPAEERETVDAGLRQIAFLDTEIAEVERLIALHAMQWPQIGRLMTVPGVNLVVAATFLAAVGDIRRFPNTNKLVGYRAARPGLVPRPHESFASSSYRTLPLRHGYQESARPRWHSRKQAKPAARRALTRRRGGPLRAFSCSAHVDVVTSTALFPYPSLFQGGISGWVWPAASVARARRVWRPMSSAAQSNDQSCQWYGPRGGSTRAGCQSPSPVRLMSTRVTGPVPDRPCRAQRVCRG
jgi:transposase